MSGICFLVVVDSYAIALIPSLFLPPSHSPFLLSSRRLKREVDVRVGGREVWGRGVTRWGLFLMRGVNFFSFFPKTKSVYYTLTLFLWAVPA